MLSSGKISRSTVCNGSSRFSAIEVSCKSRTNPQPMEFLGHDVPRDQSILLLGLSSCGKTSLHSVGFGSMIASDACRLEPTSYLTKISIPLNSNQTFHVLDSSGHDIEFSISQEVLSSVQTIGLFDCIF